MEELINQYLTAYNRKDVAGMMALLHDVIVLENVSNTAGVLTLSGRTAFETQARQALDLFRSRRQTVRSITLGNRTAAVEIDYVAVLNTEWPAGPDAEALRPGDTLTLRGVTIFAFSDGKISRISDYS